MELYQIILHKLTMKNTSLIISLVLFYSLIGKAQSKDTLSESCIKFGISSTLGISKTPYSEELKYNGVIRETGFSFSAALNLRVGKYIGVSTEAGYLPLSLYSANKIDAKLTAYTFNLLLSLKYLNFVLLGGGGAALVNSTVSSQNIESSSDYWYGNYKLGVGYVVDISKALYIKPEVTYNNIPYFYRHTYSLSFELGYDF